MLELFSLSAATFVGYLRLLSGGDRYIGASHLPILLALVGADSHRPVGMIHVCLCLASRPPSRGIVVTSWCTKAR
jgi:hypothetical protein